MKRWTLCLLLLLASCGQSPSEQYTAPDACAGSDVRVRFNCQMDAALDRLDARLKQCNEMAGNARASCSETAEQKFMEDSRRINEQAGQ